jgi:hypothetical protein
VTTELDIARQDGHAEIVPVRPKAGTAAAAMDMLREHAEMMSMAFELAKNMVGTSMVPKIYQRKHPKDEEAAQNATAAILYGLELGLNPIQSLQQVFSVHGTPAIYAKTMVALLKSKGYKFKTIETGPERVTYSGWWPGEDPETSTWDIERADRAGFIPKIDPDTGKYKTKKFDGPSGKYEKLIGNEKYLTQPEEMLWAKAATTVCKRLAPDVLLGIAHTVEDLESEPDPDPVRVRSERMYTDRVSDAEVADSMPSKVQRWHAPTDDGSGAASGDTAASEPSAKPDTAEVAAPAEPVQREPEEPATEQAPAAAPRETPPTDQQIKELKSALVREGLKTARQQVEYLRTQFNRATLGAIFDLTGEECAKLTHFLMTAPTAAEQLPVDGNGGE